MAAEEVKALVEATFAERLLVLLKKSELVDETLSIITLELHQCCYVHPVRFEMIFEEFQGRVDYMRIFDYLEGEMGESFKEIKTALTSLLDTLTWETVIYPGFTLNGFSNSTGNDDTRGGGCGKLGLIEEDFKYTMTTNGNITVRHLAEMMYRLKGSKYDWWYELCNGFTIESHTEKELTIKVGFGYGS